MAFLNNGDSKPATRPGYARKPKAKCFKRKILSERQRFLLPLSAQRESKLGTEKFKVYYARK